MATKNPTGRSEKGEGKRGRRRGWDAVVMALVLWSVPMTLFGWVGFQIAEAMGTDPFQYLPSIQLWQVALFVTLLVGAIGGFVVYRSNHRPEEVAKRRGRWDSYSDSAYESKN